MSTIIATNFGDGTLTIPSTDLTNGSAKAWANFNQVGTQTIRNSYNVASLTDVAVGWTHINFTAAMAAADYAASGLAGVSDSNSVVKLKDVLTTYLYVEVSNSNLASIVDRSHVHAIVHHS